MLFIDFLQIIHQIIASFHLLVRAEFLTFCQTGFILWALLPVIRPKRSLSAVGVVPVGGDITTIFQSALGQESEGQSAFEEGATRDSIEKDVRPTTIKPIKTAFCSYDLQRKFSQSQKTKPSQCPDGQRVMVFCDVSRKSLDRQGNQTNCFYEKPSVSPSKVEELPRVPFHTLGNSHKSIKREMGSLLFGFRSYDPEVGRWLSRDPIEEDGGWNRYVFSFNGPTIYVDVHGLAVTKDECNNVKYKLSSSPGSLSGQIRRLTEDMAANGCAIPPVGCTCCTDPSELGGYDGSAIDLCYNNISSVTELIENVQHEVVHAWQDCHGRINPPFDCDQAACLEIQAYLNDGGCQRAKREGKISSVRECVIEGATNSAEGHCPSRADAEASVRRQYNGCNSSTP